jgi:LysR family transcriptional regulator (chromosome initiation inhibitor)
LDRDQLETFATVVEQQSFERAASVLNVSRGAVSQRIKALEESLATVLLVRDKPVVPTNRGEVLLRHVKALRLLEDATLQELLPDPALGKPVAVAIAVNTDSLATWFMEVVRLLLQQRRVALELIVDDVDHTFPLLTRGEVIGCVSSAARAAQGFVAEPLGEMEYRCIASPAFAAAYFPDGITLQAVLAAPAVLLNRKDALHDIYLAELFDFTIERYAKHYAPSLPAVLDMIDMGAGYGMVPTRQVQAQLDRGALVDLAPAHPVSVKLYWHHWQTEPLLSRDITQLVMEEARRSLGPLPAA